jgi:hypothetical protein
MIANDMCGIAFTWASNNIRGELLRSDEFFRVTYIDCFKIDNWTLKCVVLKKLIYIFRFVAI